MKKDPYKAQDPAMNYAPYWHQCPTVYSVPHLPQCPAIYYAPYWPQGVAMNHNAPEPQDPMMNHGPYMRPTPSMSDGTHEHQDTVIHDSPHEPQDPVMSHDTIVAQGPMTNYGTDRHQDLEIEGGRQKRQAAVIKHVASLPQDPVIGITPHIHQSQIMNYGPLALFGTDGPSVNLSAVKFSHGNTEPLESETKLLIEFFRVHLDLLTDSSTGKISAFLLQNEPGREPFNQSVDLQNVSVSIISKGGNLLFFGQEFDNISYEKRLNLISPHISLWDLTGHTLPAASGEVETWHFNLYVSLALVTFLPTGVMTTRRHLGVAWTSFWNWVDFENWVLNPWHWQISSWPIWRFETLSANSELFLYLASTVFASLAINSRAPQYFESIFTILACVSWPLRTLAIAYDYKQSCAYIFTGAFIILASPMPGKVHVTRFILAYCLNNTHILLLPFLFNNKESEHEPDLYRVIKALGIVWQLTFFALYCGLSTLLLIPGFPLPSDEQTLEWWAYTPLACLVAVTAPVCLAAVYRSQMRRLAWLLTESVLNACVATYGYHLGDLILGGRLERLLKKVGTRSPELLVVIEWVHLICATVISEGRRHAFPEAATINADKKGGGRTDAGDNRPRSDTISPSSTAFFDTQSGVTPRAPDEDAVSEPVPLSSFIPARGPLFVNQSRLNPTKAIKTSNSRSTYRHHAPEDDAVSEPVSLRSLLPAPGPFFVDRHD